DEIRHPHSSHLHGRERRHAGRVLPLHVRADRRSGKTRLSSGLGDRASFQRLRRHFAAPADVSRRRGAAVAVLPLHDPLKLAESYAMADVISGGRLDFGIGKGSEPVEYRKFGARQDEATARFGESAEIMRQAWSDEPVNFSGEFYRYENITILPNPAQRPPPPIWVGATRNEATFRWAGEMG